MKQKDLIKKYWFVLIIAVCALIFVAFYTVQDSKNQKTKIVTAQKDGKYLIYQLGEEVYTADELYDDLYTNNAMATVFRQLEKMTLSSLYPATSEMKNLAANNAQYILTQYSEDVIAKEMYRAGFNGIKGLNDYYIYLQQETQFTRDYFMNHIDDVVLPFVQKNNSKMISHILIKVANVEQVTDKDGGKTYIAHPTEEEQAKLQEVQKALETNDFASVAKQYSEDSSATNGGSLGYYDLKVGSQYVPEFSAVADVLKEEQVSEVVLSQFGWHIIRCDAETPESLLKEDIFINNLRSESGQVIKKEIYLKAKELGISVEDERIREDIEAAFEIPSEVK